VHRATTVIDCTGIWERPNPAEANGLPALGEMACRQRSAYGIPDVLGRQRDAYGGWTTLVLGSGHSAINAAFVLSLRHPESEVYIAGMKSYGRMLTLLLAMGYEQVKSAAATVAGDVEAAA
jgi:hypothetical protein